MKKLFVVALPIGNLKDITQRAKEILNTTHLIICEDTRETKKLLSAYQIKNKQLLSYHKFSKERDFARILKEIEKQNEAVLVSDAGTPAISDPGSFLIRLLLEKFKDEIQIIGVPGPSAVTLALSISGFDCDKFVFLGFAPHKKGRESFFEEVKNEKRTIVFFESKHRVIKTLEKLVDVIPKREVMLARELTKAFEATYRGFPKEVLEILLNDKVLGEFVFVINKTK